MLAPALGFSLYVSNILWIVIYYLIYLLIRIIYINNQEQNQNLYIYSHDVGICPLYKVTDNKPGSMWQSCDKFVTSLLQVEDTLAAAVTGSLLICHDMILKVC